MKNLKFNLLAVMLIMASASLTFVSCDDDDDDDPVVVIKTVLDVKIVEAEALIASTTEGTAEGQYLPGSQAELQAVIDVAELVSADADATQVEVDNTVISIDAAIVVYNSKIVEGIAPEALVGHWTFDDGTGTTVSDLSGNGFDGTFKTGHTGFGAGTPTWATDRYGNEGKAIQFDKGALVEVPYNTTINPKQMTIACWVNADVVRENNRFLGLQSWNGFKFQLQSGNKPFYTGATTDAIYDREGEPVLDTLKWYHLAVTFGGGNTVFYTNGVQIKTWDDTPGDLVTVTGHNLAFGTSTNKFADTGDNYDTEGHADYHVIPVAWGGYFHGRLDEIRMYNTVLTASQIESIYNLEKVTE